MKSLITLTLSVVLFFGIQTNTHAQCTALYGFDMQGVNVTFDDLSSTTSGTINSWFWDFGDGSTSTLQNPTHTFPDIDIYEVCLTITTTSGCSNQICSDIEPCDLTITANIGDCDANEQVQVDITISDAYDNAIEVDVLLDGVLVPGSPFDIDDNAPVMLTLTVAGDGLTHTISAISNDIAGCQEEFIFTAPDCGSNCFLSALAVSFQGGTTHNVNVGGNFFAPASITVTAGDMVHWLWIDGGHTTTSDATSGPDSWNSGELGQGATYDKVITNPGVHPYYCIPHGGPGGAGMSANIIANCPAGNNFDIDITFNTSQANPGGFNLKIDGIVQPGSPFPYSGTGPQLVSISVAGDGLIHVVQIEDVDIPTCVVSKNFTAPDCGAAPSCALSVTAVENGPCSPANTVPVDLTVPVINGGSNGFNVTVDGNTVPGSPFPYTAGGPTMITINVPGNGQSHNIVVTDALTNTCTANTAITTTDCTIPCLLSNLTATTGSAVTHNVQVEDFAFNPANISIADGDVIQWQWTGAVSHTSTSDATTGADSWDSGLLGQGATYLSPVLSTGVHPYYCIPHGAPGGVGMAGTITVQANCTNSQVAVLLTFSEQGGNFNGFNVLIDGTNIGTFPYDDTGITSLSINVNGDGQSHTITIQDVGSAGCSVTTNIVTPDCNASTCQLTVSAQENGACDANNNVPVDVTVTDVGGGASGFNVLVDGNNAGTFSYSGTGATIVTVNVIGDGLSHNIQVVDITDPTCNNTTTITTTNCTIPCSITNLTASTGSSVTHVVAVQDFQFAPANITISDGDIIQWQWTGVIAHTTTSDATSGPNSWDSGLLNQGATYLSPVLSAGVHPYYCIPHGAPGGVGMAGTITVQANCTNGQVAVQLTFNEAGGSFGGFNVLVDGTNVGTFPYDNSGTTSISINVAGDGAAHTIQIQDVDEATCNSTTTITTPDCNASTCQVTVSALENGACDANNNVPVDVTVTDVGGGASGFNVLVDGNNVGTFSYSGTGTTIVTVNVIGDGLSHNIQAVDITDPTCNNTATITTTNCTIPCGITNLTASTGSSVTHVVAVQDFQFAPANITISDGDIIEWQWTGVIAHTSTSDATSGPNSWDSGLLNQGATYLSPVLSAGVHPYYCIPHGAPGGVGMAGTITVQANCTNGQVAVQLTFNEAGGSFGGFNVLVDGTNVGTFPYDNSGTTSISINVAGDGAAHTIQIQDVDEATCNSTTTIITPDCNASTCQLTVSAQENGACDANNNVPVDVTVTDVGGGASGFNVLVDGNNVGTFSYSGTGTTIVTVNVIGDGLSHNIQAVDITDPTCNNTTTITTTNCSIPCGITNLTASTGSSVTHVVAVQDFQFAPANITISDGDIIQWQWTGVIAHTSTSDATSGPNSWDSGLLNQGATYLSPVLSAGVHPYYCIPHGAPGGVGMAGTITVQANCTNGEVAVQLTFNEAGGSFGGFNVLVDGTNVGTFPYDNSGTTSISINVAGDGAAHTIQIQDVDEATCNSTTTITTPDCNASTCQVTVSAQENGACDANNNVPVNVTVTDVGGGASGFNVLVDGNNVGTFSYSGTGTTIVTVNVPGNGLSHNIQVVDITDPTCNNTTTITTTNCTIPCGITNLTASTGSSVTHVVAVQDFQFAPANITISDGDIIEWQWTGVIAHTTTSDATSGANSWDSGLLNQGATYLSPVLSAGVHPYYCIPHGAPGGVGMAGTITVQPNCTNGQVAVQLTFNEAGGSFGGFRVFVDGTNIGTFPYDNSGTTSISINLAGNGAAHTIQVRDVADATCNSTTTITTPDCNASTCQLTVSAQENGACNANNNVPVDVTVTDVGGGASGFNVMVDGNNAGTFSYSVTGTTVVTVNVIGDGMSHNIQVVDISDPTCNNTTTITTTNCTIPCGITNLTASTGSSVTHVVAVQDFQFAPANITISDGDIIEWQWTGVIAHTVTSDATSGANSWDSGLLNQGATYLSPVLSAGVHPYYCIPHGAPGGVGMAGTITVQPNCTNGQVAVQLTFNEAGGSFGGFRVFVDGTNIGTFPYDNSGTTSININVAGDGAAHTIQVRDVADATCNSTTTITTPDCNASTCQLTVSAQANGGCDANNNVPVNVTVNDVGGGASGFNVLVDGNNVGTFSYSVTGTTVVTVNVPGNGASHSIQVVDISDPTCNNTTTITTTNCTIPCGITNLTASTGSSVTHVVAVQDFQFAPANITISDGDIIEWQWTGVIAHTATSDATSGANSWDSGLLNQGATYLSPVLSAGVHPYYCIPHGAPGGVGMAGTITVQANCTNGEVAVQLTFNEAGGSFGGFNVLVDGTNVGTFPYDNSGTTSISINVAGDGAAHTIQIQDVDEATCNSTTTITTPDCNASTCQVTVSAQENGACDANNNVPVNVTVTDVGGGASGFNVLVDGNNVGTFSYNATGTTLVTVNVPGNGASHNIQVVDISDPTCNNTTTITTTNCTIPCSITNFTASTGSSVTHVVAVQDFQFAPANITISDGDIIQWQWTGVIAHTATSDATSGPNSWDSGLLNQGATYLSPVLSAGVHPYYCIPHGAPDGVGMAGTITVQPNCSNGQVAVQLTFNEAGGSFGGFNVLVDGTNVGTFSYDNSGTTSISINIAGDGAAHTIQIQDVDEATCNSTTTITTPDCNASTCQLTVSAQENGACDANNNVPVNVTVSDVGGGASGFNVLVDGNNVGTFSYNATGTTVVTVNVPGNGASHSLQVVDISDPTCNNTTTITTTNCEIPCQLSNLTLTDAGGGTPTTHTVLVEDFEFIPANISITIGDVVHFDWTGVIAHTSTSDATSGQDVWNSGLLGQGAVYDVTPQTVGTHPYYCIPHGAPGGIGMAGTIEVLPPCDNGQVAVTLNFESVNGGFLGYNVFVDGQLYPGSPFAYSGNGINQLTINLPGDGASHLIAVTDVSSGNCTLSSNIITSDCGDVTPCSLSLTASTSGGCDAQNQVTVNLLLESTGAGLGFQVFVDGNLYPGSPFTYGSGNSTSLNLSLAGTGTNRLIEVVDTSDPNCMASATVAVPLCGPLCEVLNLGVTTAATHVVEVQDFEFFPPVIDVLAGDTVLFVWTGVIPHTSTSDALSGTSSWASSLLGQGGTFEVVLTAQGTHPYYCIPHGGPGGIGMAGVINVVESCNNGMATVAVNFETTNGSPLGYRVFLDGNLIAGPIAYDDPAGFNSTLVEVPGDNSTHLLTVQDLEVGFCAATTSFVTPFCEVLCEIQNLSAITGTAIVHEVEVKDFEFEPAVLNVRTGETVNFIWTGNIPHTSTSDALSGPDQWESGLLSQGEQYSTVINTPGAHPYYCIPHGGPNGIGMAAMINATANCENGMVAVEINFNITSGSPNGYHIFVDGFPIPDNPIAYDNPTGMNTHVVEVPGDGAVHLITVQDADVAFCAATTTVTVVDCDATCTMSDLTASLSAPEVHVVEVLDFSFAPSELTINLGDTLRFVWTGVVPHTATSDALSGVDSWDSGLLGQGSVYDVVIENEGFHPYYCIPHGGPNGIGMAGSVTVVNNNCVNGMVSAKIQFSNGGGSSGGYQVYVDGLLYPGGPFAYAAGGGNELTLLITGDGFNHDIVVTDTEDILCTDNTVLLTPNCSTDCHLSATATLLTDCDANDQSSYNLEVNNQNAGTAFNVSVDGNLLPGSPFAYDADGSTLLNVLLPGDGAAHSILIADVDSLNCSAIVTLNTTDCNPACNITLTAIQAGDCNANNMLPYNIQVAVQNTTATAFNLFIDGIPFGGNPVTYTGAQTLVAIFLPGDGQSHALMAQDVNEATCSDMLSVNTIDCGVGCNLLGLTVELEVPQSHEIAVEDFVFDPVYQIIETKDTVRWVWTGVVPHTATSDLTTGPDVWNSGLLGQGAEYEYVIQTDGIHGYYCVPHGSPGGIGMAGTIESLNPLADTMMFIRVTFTEVNGSVAGFRMLYDNMEIGTYAYHPSGVNSVMLEVMADGQTHEVRVEDLAMADCLAENLIQLPDYTDPCYDFVAAFEAEVNHQTFEVNFTDLSNNAVSWLWTFGNGDASTLQHPNYTYPEAGVYEVCLEVEDAEGCESVYCEMLEVGAYLCEAAFAYEINGLQITFEDQSETTEPITNWEWNFGNNISLTGVQHPTYTYSDLGIYEVCLTITAGACMEDTCVVLDLSDPCLSFVADYSYVVDGNDYSVQFVDLTTGNANQWLWGFGDGTTSNLQNPAHTYAAPGNYNVCLLVQDTDLGCNESLCEVVQVGTTGLLAPPNPNLSLQLFPNPVEGGDITWVVTGIQAMDFGQQLPMTIYDTRGRTIIQQDVAGGQTMTIGVRDLTVSGVYFIEIQGEEYVYRAKVVVE